jgi:hypothetical protein
MQDNIHTYMCVCVRHILYEYIYWISKSKSAASSVGIIVRKNLNQ